MSPDPPLRVTFVVYTLQAAAGVERATTLIAGGLAARGHQVRVVTTWGGESHFPLHPAVHLHALRREKGSFKQTFVRDVLALRAHLQRHPTDLLIGAETSVMLLALPAAAGLGVACVAWEHFNFNTVFNRPRGALNRWRLARRLTARLARAVVVLTRRDAELWRGGLPGLRARLEVIANPLPFAPEPANPYDPERRVVLAAGRLTEQKGFDLLIDAWTRLEKDFPDWTLRIVGGGGEEEANLRAQVDRAGLRRVVFAGQVQDMAAEYRAAGLYCLSSRYEGLPMVLLECQAHGLPVVAFDCETGPREVIEHGVSGLLVPPQDPAALAAALRDAMSDPARRVRLSGRSHAAASRFRPQQIVAEWEGLLGSLGPPTHKTAPASRHGAFQPVLKR
ncbi:glycosyltransferase family 4 protein [Deinococcus budaensis]|uniref:Glycosyltransferase involved in cell wall biosynthesis n=1 Tax=Deinococcus budaensis TaxID=1665626 RepID=A0A7W8GE22_9DEIO|nr:glycosyltransferase family 4 protein [Deinococcus budaensis]MBB5233865.1 glycosyltransferase involved in cell wall biosynthesis [Deinococcus budaensis]